MRNQAQEYRICFREFLRKSIRIYNCREKKIYIKKERKKIIFFDIICFFLINIMKNYESFKLHILQTNKDPANKEDLHFHNSLGTLSNTMVSHNEVFIVTSSLFALIFY